MKEEIDGAKRRFHAQKRSTRNWETCVFPRARNFHDTQAVKFPKLLANQSREIDPFSPYLGLQVSACFFYFLYLEKNKAAVALSKIFNRKTFISFICEFSMEVKRKAKQFW